MNSRCRVNVSVSKTAGLASERMMGIANDSEKRAKQKSEGQSEGSETRSVANDYETAKVRK